MSLRHRLFGFYVSFVSICMLGAIVYAPQDAHGQPPGFPDGKLIILIPQFVAEAVSFKAIDESGYDWPGSDEVYAVFSDLNPNLRDLVTSTNHDVDTGETRTFGPDDRCIAPQSKCDHAVSEILRFEVAFWEDDYTRFPPTFCYGDAPGLHYILRHGKCSGDDLIGRGEVLMSREQLLAALPRVGDSVEYKLTLGGPCGYQPDQSLCGTGWPPSPTGPEYAYVPDHEAPRRGKAHCHSASPIGRFAASLELVVVPDEKSHGWVRWRSLQQAAALSSAKFGASPRESLLIVSRYAAAVARLIS